ncbi:hypothetical protein IQ06DRAFT_82404 [Phaeosphaeriaceae sp. SRC1lsM3a]|nr:hypothetical protein IQ06DRAFT_82404 [Stagonospora sp. SRC1lsM3a]
MLQGSKRQRQLDLQSAWPTQNRRHDSIISCSSSSAYEAAKISPNQATAQPQLPVVPTVSPDTLLQSRGMERMDSQSSMSPNQQRFHDRQHASVGHGSAVGECDMSRASTQHSNISASCHTLSTLAQPHNMPYQFERSGHVTPSEERTVSTSSNADTHFRTLQLSTGMGSLFASNLGKTQPTGPNDSPYNDLVQLANDKDRALEQTLNFYDKCTVSD